MHAHYGWSNHHHHSNCEKKLHCFLAHNFVRKIKLSVMTKPFITKNEEDGHEKCMNQNDTILKKGFILCSHFCY